MPVAVLEKEISGLSPTQRDAVAMFVRFLLTQGDDFAQRYIFNYRKKPVKRELGLFAEGFSISSDFDAPIEDFAEYM